MAILPANPHRNTGRHPTSQAPSRQPQAAQHGFQPGERVGRHEEGPEWSIRPDLPLGVGILAGEERDAFRPAQAARGSLLPETGGAPGLHR